MTTLMSLMVKLGIDSGELDSGLSQAERKAKSSSSNIAASFTSAGKSMTRTGTAMTAGLTLPIVGVGTAMISAASDLEESANAMNVVFGQSKAIMEDYGKTVAQTAGLSQSDFNQLSAVMGAFLKNVGYSTDEAAKGTITLTERAADMASIFNTDVSQALQAIQSGLKGEFNPLEQFGVKINAAAIETKALAMGLAETKSELTDSMKATAALALVMEQTEQFAGDFVNTSDGLANSTKIMKAEFTDAAAALGTQLLPMALKLVGFLSGLIDKFNALTPAQQNTILTILGIVAVIGPLLMVIGSLATAIGAIIPVVTAIAGVISFPLIAIIAAVIAVIALLYTAWTQNWGDIQGKFEAFIAWIKPVWDALWAGMVVVFDFVWAQIKTLWEAFSLLFQGDFEGFGEKLREGWDRAWQAIIAILKTAWTGIQTIVKNLIQNVIDFFKNVDWGQVGKNIVLGIANGIKAGLKWVVDAAKAVAKAALDAAKGFLGIKSPSAVFENVIGKNMALGLVQGFDNTLDATALKPSMTGMVADVQGVGMVSSNAGGNEGGAQNSTTVNVYNPQPEPASQSVRRELTKLNYVGIPA